MNKKTTIDWNNYMQEIWIFGKLSRDTRKGFLVKVNDRSAKMLMAAMLDNIETGSILYSDSWRAYNAEKLEKAGFHHFKVNFRYNFVDTLVHTQTIE